MRTNLGYKHWQSEKFRQIIKHTILKDTDFDSLNMQNINSFSARNEKMKNLNR